VYRDEYYNPESQDVGKAEIIIAKQRNGPTGTVALRYTKECTRFDNLEREAYDFDEEFDGFQEVGG
jgi:replicative DNA helicase